MRRGIGKSRRLLISAVVLALLMLGAWPGAAVRQAEASTPIKPRFAETPKIVEPADVTVSYGDDLKLDVKATVSDGGTLSYQWYTTDTNDYANGPITNPSPHASACLNGDTDAICEALTTPTIDVRTARVWYYFVVVTNTNDDASDFKTATTVSRLIKVTVSYHYAAAQPNFSQDLADQTVHVGDYLVLPASANLLNPHPSPNRPETVLLDRGILSYQWYSNSVDSTSGGSPIAGAIGPYYVAPTEAEGTTYYYVEVTNTNNNPLDAVVFRKKTTVTSRVAKVTVNPAAPPSSGTGTDAATPSASVEFPLNDYILRDWSRGLWTFLNMGDDSPIASVAATVTDGGTLSYQWYRNTVKSTSGGSPIAGATDPYYIVPTTMTSTRVTTRPWAETTYYYVVVTNTNNNVSGTKTATATSGLVEVNVVAIVDASKPIIDTQPADLTVDVNDNASLSVVSPESADRQEYRRYQWYRNENNSTSGGSLIVGATSASYDVPTTIEGTVYYYVDVTNFGSPANGRQNTTVTSKVAKVTVGTPVNAATPSIVTQPASTTAVNVGGSASLSVAATVSDSGTLSYQWYSNATNSNSGGSLIAGATGASYAAPTTTAGTTYYYVVVTNTNNSVNGTKTATATSNAAKVTVAPIVNAATPSIATQPASTTAVNVGGSASLSVAATVSDSGTLSYQWYSNATNSNSGGSLIAGATGATYAAPTTTAGTTYYYVVVTNTNNSVNGTKTATAKSNVATVNVTREAQRVTAITVSSASDTLYVGDSLQFNATVAPNNAADKTFSWSVVPGTGAATISANGLLAATGAGTVTVQATAHDGSGVVGKKSITITNRPSGGSGGGAAPVVTKPVIDKNGVEHVPTTIDTTKPSVTLEVTPKDGAAYVSIPGSILTDLADKNANFFIEIKAPYGSYQVPVHLASLIPGLPDMMAKNGLKAEDISFKITVTDKSGDKDIQATLANNLQIGQVLGAIVDFHMDIVNVKTGQMIGKADKFSQALTRIIPMPKNMTDMPEQWGAFRYNETTKKLEFVPAKKALIDGVWYVTINSYSNSVYVVTKNPVGFTDTLKAWSKPYVELAAAKGLVQGVGDGKYDPDKAATRAEFTAMLVRALGRSAYVGSTATYEDVKQGAWYFDEIAQAKELGLLGFVKGTSFNPDQPLTREEMASMLAAAIRLENSSIARDTVNLNGYKDIGSVDAAYLEDVRTMVTLQIMNGISANTFDPKGLTSRAQAAVVFIRMLQSLGLIDK